MFRNVLIFVGLLILLQDIYECSDVDTYEKEVEATEDVLVGTPLGIGCINQSESMPTCQQEFKPEESAEYMGTVPLQDTDSVFLEMPSQLKRKSKKKRKKKDKKIDEEELIVATPDVEDDSSDEVKVARRQ